MHFGDEALGGAAECDFGVQGRGNFDKEGCPVGAGHDARSINGLRQDVMADLIGHLRTIKNSMGNKAGLEGVGELPAPLNDEKPFLPPQGRLFLQGEKMLYLRVLRRGYPLEPH